MKSKYIIAIVIVIIALTSAVVIFTINSQKVNIKSKCCIQCIYAANHDVRGFDTSRELCSSDYYTRMKKFNEQTGLVTDENVFTSECIDYFKNSLTPNLECR